MTQPISQNLHAAEELVQQGKIKQACSAIEQLSAQNPDNHLLRVFIARCYLALGNTEQALRIYTPLSAAKQPEYAETRCEALLALGKYKQALQDYEGLFKQKIRPAEALFLAALAAYKCGVIIKARLLLKQAASKEYEWEENTSLDVLVYYLLPGLEFTDFEQLYLDAGDQVETRTEGYDNRWMSLNIPVYEFLRTPANQRQNLAQVLDLLGAGELGRLLENGRQELDNMLQEMTDLETDARFGLEALKLLQEGHFPELAGLIMALLLEQISRDSAVFGLEAEFINASQFQQLVVALPLRIATALLLLFSIAKPITHNQEHIQKMDENILAGLLALCIMTCNREIKNLQN
ncbi:MAG TPA: tetratricopeptide repeat protein [bacterium]|nr:tetratricopeptide repeat protein [bacterium]HPN43592.1 tetratricopeptide repeat protein [bacterium]